MVDEPEKKDEVEEELDDEPEGLTETDEKIDEDVNAEDESKKQQDIEDAKKFDAELEKEAREDTSRPFDSEILSIAADLGVSKEQALAKGTVGKLEEYLYELTEQHPSEPEKKDEGKDEKQTPVKMEAGDDLDEALVGKINDALGKITGRYDERYTELEKTITGLQENLQASQAAQFISQFDRMLTEHGGGYGELLGEGGTMALDPNGKEAGRRADIIQVMQTTVQVCQSGNRKIPSDEQLLKRALTEVCGEPTAKQDKLNGKVQSRQGQSLRRASSRGGRPVTAADKRRDAERDLQEKLNALSSDEEASVYEEKSV